MINISLETGLVQNSLKLAKVIPIYKAKAKDDFSNYRPISILPSVSKILEKVINKRLYFFLQNSKLFFSNQYGFRKNHSTLQAVTKLITDIIESNENRETTMSVFLDLSKAFDTINHKLLLSKLEFYGIRGIALDWFKNYLANRKQYVIYNNKTSDNLDITCGVPQKSVLGPLLFIVYTNDLPDCIEGAETILFADDTTICQSSDNIELLYHSMNDNLDRLTDWFKANKLSLNINKSNYMIFPNKRHIDPSHNLSIANTNIDQVKSTKFLGIHIDQQLKWDVHVDSIKSKISSSLFIMNKVKHFISTSLMKILYYSMVYPYLTYGIALWGSTFQCHIHKLKVLQKKAIRCISGAKYNAHSDPIFKQLSILKFDDIYKLNVANIMLTYVREELSIPLQSIFRFDRNTHAFNARLHDNKYRIESKRWRTIVASQSILYQGPKIWNDIRLKYYLKKNDHDAGYVVSVSCFTTRLVKYLCSSYDT